MVQIDNYTVVTNLITAGVTLFVSAVAFRTRLYGMTRDIAQARTDAARDLSERSNALALRLDGVEGAVKRYGPTLSLIDRRTLYILQILAEQSKAAGLDRRVPDDLIVRLMTEAD